MWSFLPQPAVRQNLFVSPFPLLPDAPAVRTGQRQKQLLIKKLFEGDAFSLLTAQWVTLS
jgi:hypothetical protein